jgi:hypothetical protein
MREFETIDDVRITAKNRGSHWFEPSTMRFFKSRVGRPGTIYKGVYFVSSEQFDHNSPRLYSIRKVTCTHNVFDISTVGEFQGFKSSSSAIHHIKYYL